MPFSVALRLPFMTTGGSFLSKKAWVTFIDAYRKDP